jgi:hypothetical protein
LGFLFLFFQTKKFQQMNLSIYYWSGASVVSFSYNTHNQNASNKLHLERSTSHLILRAILLPEPTKAKEWRKCYEKPPPICISTQELVQRN